MHESQLLRLQMEQVIESVTVAVDLGEVPLTPRFLWRPALETNTLRVLADVQACSLRPNPCYIPIRCDSCKVIIPQPRQRFLRAFDAYPSISVGDVLNTLFHAILFVPFHPSRTDLPMLA